MNSLNLFLLSLLYLALRMPNVLIKVCNDVCIEPDHQSIDGEVIIGSSSNTQDGARLDMSANGFWSSRFERTFLDVWVFNPHAPSHRHPHCYRKHELEKKH